MHKSIAAAIVAGLAVVAIWSVLTWLSGWSLGILALFIGTAVGLAFRIVAKDQTSKFRGLVAAAIALGCILIGKYASASIHAHARIAESVTDEPFDVDEAITCEIADDLVAGYQEREVELVWPEIDFESDNPAAHYPEGIWYEAQKEFAALSDDQKALRRAEYEGHLAADTQTAAGAISLIYFLFSFGPTGLIVLGISVGGAYKIASGHEKTEEAVAEAAPSFSIGSPLRGMPTASPDSPVQRNAA